MSFSKSRNNLIAPLSIFLISIISNFQVPAAADQSSEGYINDDKIKIVIERKNDLDSIEINPRGKQIIATESGVFNDDVEAPLGELLNYSAQQVGGAYRKSSYMVPCASGQSTGVAIYSATDNEEQTASVNQTNGIPYICHPRNSNTSPTDPNSTPDTTPNLQASITLTIQDLQELGLSPTPTHQQNPPHTLKNYNTNFWAEPNPQEFHTQINGIPVTARAIPTHYTFNYGDSSEYTTTHPGYKLPDDVWDEPTPTSHQYKKAGDYTFTLTTYYRGEFSVAGGPWQVMVGQGVTVSDPLLVRVWRAEVGLVAEDCLANPSGWGCPGAE